MIYPCPEELCKLVYYALGLDCTEDEQNKEKTETGNTEPPQKKQKKEEAVTVKSKPFNKLFTFDWGVDGQTMLLAI